MLKPEPGNGSKKMRPESHDVILTLHDCAVVVSYVSHLGGSWFCTHLGDRVFRGFSWSLRFFFIFLSFSCKIPGQYFSLNITVYRPSVLHSRNITGTFYNAPVNKLRNKLSPLLLNWQKNSGAVVRQRTIPVERPPLVGEVSANFSG
jgi:hypothetical protein